MGQRGVKEGDPDERSQLAAGGGAGARSLANSLEKERMNNVAQPAQLGPRPDAARR